MATALASLDPFTGLGHVFGQAYLRHAFLAGTAIALAAGLVGHFLVLRSQVFAGDTLSHVAFTGALAALVAGASLWVGLYGSCVAVGMLLAVLGTRGRADDTVIGSVFAWVLGIGALLLTVYATSRGASDATAGVSVLFGSIFGLSGSQAQADAVVGAVVAMAVVVLGRPLLFASLDPTVAGARGVPVRTLDLAFLVLAGVTAGAATQAVGSLLLLGLVAAPAGAARHLTVRPFRALWISGGIAVASMWAGLAIAYAAPSLPPSFSIVAVSTGCFVAAAVAGSARRLRQGRSGRGVAGTDRTSPGGSVP